MIQLLVKAVFERLEKNMNRVEEVFRHMPSLSNVSRGKDKDTVVQAWSNSLQGLSDCDDRPAAKVKQSDCDCELCILGV
jgi:hypothetical protein